MIREFKPEDTDAVMDIWLETNILAHQFISEHFWKNHYEGVKAMLPDAELLVYDDGGEILGFVGLTGNYIAGIFVRRKNQSHGIGKMLLTRCKDRHSALFLHVYQKNTRAVRFYTNEAFTISKEQTDEETGEQELVMNWTIV